MKWQTVLLACGMDFHVYGPNSVRRNDLYMLRHSKLLQLFAELQLEDPFFFKIFGDSAYWDGLQADWNWRRKRDGVSERVGGVEL